MCSTDTNHIAFEQTAMFTLVLHISNTRIAFNLYICCFNELMTFTQLTQCYKLQDAFSKQV